MQRDAKSISYGYTGQYFVTYGLKVQRAALVNATDVLAFFVEHAMISKACPAKSCLVIALPFERVGPSGQPVLS